MAKKRRYKKSKKTASKLDIAVVIIIMLSVLLAVLIYTKSGVVGIKLNEILGGMFGIMQYVLPIGGFAIGIKLATDERDTLASKLVQYIIFIVSLSVLFSVVQISSGELQSSKELSEVVKDAYYLGGQSKGGGAIGAVAAVPLAKLLGDIGAVILCVGVAVVFLVFTFGINMSDLINMFVEKIENKREERLEEKEERNKEEARETAQERRKREREERMAEKARIKAEKIAKAQNDRDLMNNQIKTRGLKKYDHSNDDLEPLTRDSKKDMQPDVIENNLFKQEEEKKEDKRKEVLQLEHAMVVEDEHYEYPPIELLSKGKAKALKGGAKALTDTATKLQINRYCNKITKNII